MKRIILDVETAGQFGASLVYDLGFIVVDGDDIVSSHSWVIDDVFNGMPQKMRTAYYAEKLPQYRLDIEATRRRVISMRDAYNEFAAICAVHNIREVWAFNASFDEAALNHTLNVCSNGFCDRFVPAGVKIRCIMGASVCTLCQSKKYAAVAERTEKGNIRVNAESVYRYITDDPDFIEAHTGLEDCMIEWEILKQCLKRKKRMDTNPKSVLHFKEWRILQAKYA